ncbi:AcrR family transcriptional regulator [Mycobacterium frederiksbergense]|uniref:AcrR family transcriptional regulator n=1 Tax=Mycolicibacterium frederiksbergense TaxID=117567 RepID=A0ABT6L5A9_9MYCO|nr:TetR family transcriptional regulator [Mycolicibacterium frederiksbergense]MDH6198149.1 AcrR family transcriptional regulator [Mycolicibacterium frederiksbergense]
MATRGRRPGNNDTRTVLVEAASRLFAETGYEKTSLRDIAAAAGVDPALIRHYFGSKAGLFRETMGWPFEPADVTARVVDGDPAGIGERLAEVFFELWEQPESRAPLMAILRGAATHDDSAALVRQFIKGQLYLRVAGAVAGPDAELRIDLAMAQLLGVAYLRYILQLEPIASRPVAELTARVAPVVSAHLNR